MACCGTSTTGVVGYEKHWERHCSEYNACGRPVYFVRDEWYRNRFVPHYQHRDDRRGREEDRPHERDEHRDRDHRE
jgi:hypothetical protein